MVSHANGLRGARRQVKARVVKGRLLLAATLAVAGCARTAPPEAPPLAGARIGGPFVLVDGNGHPFSDRSLAGRWRVMYFGYTSCPDACPTDLQVIGAGLKRLERSDPAKAERVTPVFVTVDPARDDPAAVKAFAANFHPRMVGLTGPRAAVDAAAREYGVYYKLGPRQPGGGYVVDHTRQAYLMDAAGRPAALLPADEGPEAVEKALERWIS